VFPSYLQGINGSMPALLAALVVLAVLSGCGASGRSDDVAATVERFQAALERQDGQTACDQLGQETISRLEQQQDMPCEQAIFELELPTGGDPARTTVYVTSASVTLEPGGTLFRDEASSGWESAAAGGRPTAPELPFDCELEG
jgi:hypothetical protein